MHRGCIEGTERIEMHQVGRRNTTSILPELRPAESSASDHNRSVFCLLFTLLFDGAWRALIAKVAKVEPIQLFAVRSSVKMISSSAQLTFAGLPVFRLQVCVSDFDLCSSASSVNTIVIWFRLCHRPRLRP